jgi:opacity protein-like surface antigen
MKLSIVLFLISIGGITFSQENEKPSSSNKFQLSFLGGINISNPTGTAFLVEGKTNVSSNVNAKFSIGYSLIYKNEGYEVKTYKDASISNEYVTITQYTTYSYNLDRIRYSVIPIFLGLEYIFHRGNLSPYSVVEVGYNFYEHKEEISNGRLGFNVSSSTIEGLPQEYQHQHIISKNSSYRLALGVGINLNLTHSVDLDIRYLYQYNSSLVNTSQILIGLVL